MEAILEKIEDGIFNVKQGGAFVNCAPEYSTYLRKGYYYINEDLEPRNRDWMGPYDTASLAKKFLGMEQKRYEENLSCQKNGVC